MFVFFSNLFYLFFSESKLRCVIQLCDVRGLDMEQFEHVQQVHCEAITCICDIAYF